MSWYSNEHPAWILARGALAVVATYAVAAMAGLAPTTAIAIGGVPALLTAYACWAWRRRRARP